MILSDVVSEMHDNVRGRPSLATFKDQSFDRDERIVRRNRNGERR
ncbi:hypothetical protein EDF31_107188 [Curtobacterium sp. PhB142]|nr:hypothetical protein EDF31_107188 [Curtobacterium sp. PhB142]TCM01015.1 hypothetical protein EDF26_107188 [Curtobacterium sp. PhB134]